MEPILLSLSVCKRLILQKELTEDGYRLMTGKWPIDDMLERVNCKRAGESGHRQCGWCSLHNKPRFECGCMFFGDTAG